MIDICRRRDYGLKILNAEAPDQFGSPTQPDWLIAVVSMPKGAKFLDSGSKVRAERVRTEAIFCPKGERYSEVIHQNGWGPDTVYREGKLTKPDKFDESNFSCSHGIHYAPFSELTPSFASWQYGLGGWAWLKSVDFNSKGMQKALKLAKKLQKKQDKK